MGAAFFYAVMTALVLDIPMSQIYGHYPFGKRRWLSTPPASASERKSFKYNVGLSGQISRTENTDRKAGLVDFFICLCCLFYQISRSDQPTSTATFNISALKPLLLILDYTGIKYICIGN